MAKERISLACLYDMCSASALLAVETVQAQPPEIVQSGQSSQGDIAYVKMSHAYASRTFAREATFFIRAAAGWGQEEILCSRL